MYASADTGSGQTSEVAYAAAPLPTTTTTSTTTTTTTTTTLAPADTTDDDATADDASDDTTPDVPATTEPAGPLIDPAGFSDAPPEGVIAPVLHDLLTGNGVAPNAATCAIQTAYDRSGGENGLIALGLIDGSDDALAVVRQATADCGISSEQTEAAITPQFGG